MNIKITGFTCFLLINIDLNRVNPSKIRTRKDSKDKTCKNR